MVFSPRVSDGNRFTRGWLRMAAVILLWGSPTLRAEAPPPERGAIESSGKFVPKEPRAAASQATLIAARKEAEAALLKNLKVERIDSKQLRVGQVTIDQAARSIRFQATVNMTQGPVEYVLVAENGKLHESVFVTKASLRDIHLAMLLLGVKPGEVKPAPDRSLQIPAESAVRANVEWESNGPTVRHALATMIALAEGQPDQSSGRTLADGAWLYNGSGFDAGGFRALREGSVISLIGDDSALVNNPGSDRDRDDIHVPNTSILPRKGMPVSIILSLPPKVSPPSHP